jgi:hypothetical protein
MASVGTGNTTHVSGEWFKMMTQVDMVHALFRDLPILRSDDPTPSDKSAAAEAQLEFPCLTQLR